MEELLAGVTLERSRDALVIRAAEPLAVLSSAVLGGGARSARSIVNLHVPRGYDCRSPERDLRSFARRAGLASPLVGLMTAVPLEQARVLAGAADRITVRAVITVGLANVARAGQRAERHAAAGTINAIFLCDGQLRGSAAVELVALASEAKASALIEAGVRTSQGALATGTSTDATVIAWRRRATPEVRYAGSATAIGSLVARLVRDALGASDGG